MTGRDGNTPWEPPKDENQWESSGGDSYGWRFPFRDDNGPNDSETAAMPTPGTPAPNPHTRHRPALEPNTTRQPTLAPRT